MALHNFTLLLSGVSSDTVGLEDTLFEAGCDDALVCFYSKSVYLEFDREAETLDCAVASAIRAVEGAGINARVEAVDSTLVGLSDIAELSQLSRQAIALLKDGTRGKGDFPNPVQRITGQSPLWNWAEVAEWLVSSDRMSSDNPLVKNARNLDQWNLALRIRASRSLEKIEDKVNFLEHSEKVFVNC